MVFVLQCLQKKRPLYELYKYTHTKKHTYIHIHTPMFQANEIEQSLFMQTQL